MNFNFYNESSRNHNQSDESSVDIDAIKRREPEFVGTCEKDVQLCVGPDERAQKNAPVCGSNAQCSTKKSF